MKADARIDIEDALLSQRRIPCICDRQFEEDDPRPPRGIAIGRSRADGFMRERVKCDTCGRTWIRITATVPGQEAA